MGTEERGGLIELFQRALALPGPQRELLLAELRRESPSLARELAELLAQDERGGPLRSAASARHSLVDSLVEELERETGPDPPSSLVLEQLAARTPAASRYSIHGELARGGMGAILEVWDRDLGRTLAMKVALAQAQGAAGKTPPLDARSLARFLEEARVTGQLDHPGIVPVHELGLDREGRVYFTMRLVKGRDLGEILALVRRGEEGWTQTRALGVLLKVCEAMSYAHSNGVVHRDLKPANVMVGRFGEVYVMDWGLARARERRGAHAPADGADRGGAAGEPALHGPAATRAGAILGTPSYMAPEQAAGAEVDERCDVYALGAMLYELLGGHAPHGQAGEHAEPFAVLARVLAGPPAPLAALAPAAPAELVAICDKAMARDPRARYRDTGELAEDLRAFLEGRVVRAYETGAWAEARKWVQRNRRFAAAMAAGLLALVAGLTASLILKAQSDRNATLAAEREKIANDSFDLAEERRREAEARRDEVLRLSALQDLEDLIAEADRLWPAYPEHAGRYREWLANAERVVDARPGYEAQIAALRAKAVPATSEMLERQRREDPGFAELERVRQRLEFHRRQRAALEADEPPADPTPDEVGVDWDALPPDAAGLKGHAWLLVDPERSEWGGEARGLVLARQALALSAGLPPLERARIRDTLAWALFANGRFDEAVAEEELALEDAGPERQQFETFLGKLTGEIEDRISSEGVEEEATQVAGLERRIAELEADVPQQTDPLFTDAKDKWWHNQLVKLVDGIDAFTNPATGLLSDGTSPEHGWGLRKRLEFATTIRERSIGGSPAAGRWSEAIASIASTVECPKYRGIRITPQIGLLPIGRDPSSGLWEFAHLQTGEPAERAADGNLVLRPETGLVLVLLPGGTFTMGAQRLDPSASNYDPQARPNESPTHAVTLAAFFLSKYEMTQGQWQACTGERPSSYVGGLLPVEHVNWYECGEVCKRLGLVLPTEAQWEYGARGGTTTPWWTGNERETLAGAANLADRHAREHGGSHWLVFEDWLDDGHDASAPVGSFAANPFGLHDVHGNLWEWCRDGNSGYGSPVRPGDGERSVLGPSPPVARGGGFNLPSVDLRSAARDGAAPQGEGDDLGLRPARALAP